MQNRWLSYGVCALLLGAAVPAAADEALECADYITTSFDDEPDEGHLIGTATRTDEVSGQLMGAPAGVGVTEGLRRSETWEVGIYEMSDGSRIRIDCRDYTRET